ncbi:hypothetical protein LCGC14_1551710 [marine sediment metagenome]|uniref:Uncharacterized protein n=1 Tax=marine sediment metagenome TaxID=412755 RepID=A0A0F9L640_9ZZZZ|nr:DUF3237 domain-containing protein [Desulfobacterales bacterium]
MKLEPLMTLHGDLKAPVEIGNGPYGARTIFDATGGTFEGQRLSGKVLPSGGDWILFDADGVGHLDVRITLETQDGAYIYVQYYGVAVMNEKVNAALEQGEWTEYGDTYFMTQPRFETGDSRYKWLNAVMAVAEGRIKPGAVEYRVLELVNG